MQPSWCCAPSRPCAAASRYDASAWAYYIGDIGVNFKALLAAIFAHLRCRGASGRSTEGLRGRNVGASSSCGPYSATPTTHCIFFPPLRAVKSRGGSLGGCFPGVCGVGGGAASAMTMTIYSSGAPCASDFTVGGGSQHTPPKNRPILYLINRNQNGTVFGSKRR